MTATAILLRLPASCSGANADYYVPNRIDEGYGLNHEAIRALGARRGAGGRDGRLRHRQRRPKRRRRPSVG